MASKDETKNDLAWRRYIQETGTVLDGRIYEIQAEDLKRIARREPRLLTKFDRPEQLPKVLREHDYVLLSIRNGRYLLFPGDIFASVPTAPKPAAFSPALEFPLRTVGRGAGEMQYLDYAYSAGIISSFADAGCLYLTIRGREFTGAFDFFVGRVGISLDKVQIEVDGGYEGERDIVLVEAKIGSVGSFNIRQLYYPYRRFQALVPSKRVRCLLFTFDLRGAVYALHEFEFPHPEHLDSIRHVRSGAYTIGEMKPLALDTLIDVRFETSNNIVPQADDLNRILELLNAIQLGHDNAAAVAEYFSFAPRQSSYYREAAEYLGLVERRDGIYFLTDHGNNFLSQLPEDQRTYIAKLVVNSWVFRELVHIARERGYFSAADIEAVIVRATGPGGGRRYGGTTIGRRRQTIFAWIRWLAERVGCFREEDGRFYLN